MEKNNRPDWDEYFLNIAQEVGKRSTCMRRRYGAIIVKDKIIVSTGYNGSPRGDENCIETGICERERLHIPKGERYELCVAGDSIIKLLDGNYRTIKELADIGENFWTYAVDTNTGCIVPAQAENPRKTGIRNDMVRVTFDNGKSVICTSDHLFLLTDCTYKAAKDLNIQESIMPMYYNFAINKGYESICNTIIMRKVRPNVKILNSLAMRYRQYQGKIAKGIALLIGKMAAENDNTEINIETYSELQKKYRPTGGKRGTMEMIPLLKTILKWYAEDFEKALQAAKTFNHRVIKVEFLDTPMEVYDVTVPIYHNFPIDLGDNSCVFVHNCVAVHAEANAIINADPLKMQGSTIYIVGINVADETFASGAPCLMCRRMIKNAQISKVIYRDTNGEIVTRNVDEL